MKREFKYGIRVEEVHYYYFVYLETICTHGLLEDEGEAFGYAEQLEEVIDKIVDKTTKNNYKAPTLTSHGGMPGWKGVQREG